MTTRFPVPLVPAWYASPQPIWTDESLFPTNLVPLAGFALRQRVKLGYGGSRPRLLLSNAYSSEPVHIAQLHLAPSIDLATIDAAMGRQVLVGGETACMIPAGATILTDPVDVNIAAHSILAVTLRFDEEPTMGTFHWEGRSTAQLIEAHAVADAAPAVLDTTTARMLIVGVLVEAESRGTVVAMGDSITDGAGASLDGDSRWPDLLAERLAPTGLAVINAGISGGQLLRDGMGVNALARFERDVLAQPGIRTVVLKIGTNDIGFAGTPYVPEAAPPSLEVMAQAYRVLVARAHAAGVRVIAGTLAPFKDALPDTPFAAGYHTSEKERMRQAFNRWIRESGVFDGVVDFATILAEPADPERLAAAYDSGDHLHPNDAGNLAMANAMELDALAG